MATRTRIVSTEEVSNELIYYNLDVINSSLVDNGSFGDPVVKFEETRSTPILTDASKYNFSIIRFDINGANKDLPLFIPVINKNQIASSGQAVSVVAGVNDVFYYTYPVSANVNTLPSSQYVGKLTIPSGTYTQSGTSGQAGSFLNALQTTLTNFVSSIGTGTIPSSAFAPTGFAVSYQPNTYNVNVIASGTPNAFSNYYSTYYNALLFYDPTFAGGYPTLGSASLWGSWITTGGFNNPSLPSQNFVTFYGTGTSVQRTAPQPVEATPFNIYNTTYDTIYSVTIAGQFATGSGTLTAFTPVTKFVKWYPESTDVLQPPLDSNGFINQDIKNKYWWCYTYKHWVDCVNRCFTDLFSTLATQLNSGTLYTLPPVMTFDPNSKRFTISFDSNGFGNNLSTYLNNLVPSSLPYASTKDILTPINQDQRLNVSVNLASGSTNEAFSLFFNSNMFGLFSNFNNLYYGLDDPSTNGMDNLIIVTNEATASFNPYIVATGGTTPISKSVQDASYPRILYPMSQNYPSVSTLWSPISSIVFCSTLLPTLPENTGVPLVLNAGDNTTQNTSLNAFQPIITDISLPLDYPDDYRQFISYAPSAEYRLTSLGTSQLDIREINIQVYWKSRLTNELIPLTLFNQSNVSIKILFRRRNAGR